MAGVFSETEAAPRCLTAAALRLLGFFTFLRGQVIRVICTFRGGAGD